MKRKNWDPQQEDMKVIVPIHNLVNERAWKHILMWENLMPKTHNKMWWDHFNQFQRRSEKLTPRAWMKSIFGYDKPFDRHDWLINRCGVEVEYVIDFILVKIVKFTWMLDPN